MNGHRQGRERGGLVAGLLLIAVGALLLLDRQGIHDFGEFWRFWPVFPLLIGVNAVVNNLWRKERGSLFFGTLMIVTGVLFLGLNFDWPGFSRRLIAPVLVIGVGLGFILDALFCRAGRRDRDPNGGDS
jgi:hypothetical protein